MIRRAQPGDLDELIQLVHEFYEVDQHEYDLDRILPALKPLLEGDDLGQVWVIDDGVLSGYAIVTWSWSLESGGRDCILDEIYVREQGSGQGSRLIERALAAARVFGARAVFLETEAHNGRVLSFYERHGFAAEDSVWMSMPLASETG